MSGAGSTTLPLGPVVKICGLVRQEDVDYARDLGVWAVGFVFAPSPRRVSAMDARRLLEGSGLGRRKAGAGAQGLPRAVGVFAGAEEGEIVRTVEEAGLDAVQLHGGGPGPRAVRRALQGSGNRILVIQAVPVSPKESRLEAVRGAVAEASAEADVVLLDTKVEGRFGGTGQPFPWSLALRAVEDGAHGARLMVAGGIGPDNVRNALMESGAWGVDVSSGVESSPGVKDAQLMRQVVGRVQEGSEE